MNREKIKEIKKIISSYTPWEEKIKIKLRLKLVDDLQLDSLDLVGLVMDFEEEFDVDIADEEVKDVVTVKDVVIFLRGMSKEKNYTQDLICPYCYQKNSPYDDSNEHKCVFCNKDFFYQIRMSKVFLSKRVDTKLKEDLKKEKEMLKNVAYEADRNFYRKRIEKIEEELINFI